MAEHDEPVLLACNACGEEVLVGRIARPWDCTCADCDELDEAFAELLEPESDVSPVRVHQTRAAGHPWCVGIWVTISGQHGKRVAKSLEHVMALAGSSAVHPRDWPSHPRVITELRGLFMSYNDRTARTT